MATLKAKFNGPDLVDAACTVVDSAAGRARRAIATSIYGQDALYLQKSLEAERFMTDGSVGKLVEADMDAYGVDAATAVDQIIAARDAFVQRMTQIEAIRLKAKKQIRATSDAPFDIAKQAKADIENVQ